MKLYHLLLCLNVIKEMNSVLATAYHSTSKSVNYNGFNLEKYYSPDIRYPQGFTVQVKTIENNCFARLC